MGVNQRPLVAVVRALIADHVAERRLVPGAGNALEQLDLAHHVHRGLACVDVAARSRVVRLVHHAVVDLVLGLHAGTEGAGRQHGIKDVVKAIIKISLQANQVIFGGMKDNFNPRL